jgi:hypothetical protein
MNCKTGIGVIKYLPNTDIELQTVIGHVEKLCTLVKWWMWWTNELLASGKGICHLLWKGNKCHFFLFASMSNFS